MADSVSAESEAPPRGAVLGHDLGSQYSKLALAFKGPSDTTPRLLRVPFSGLLNDPDSPTGIVNSEYEFVSSAARDDDGGLVEGRRALAYDLCIPLKTMLVFLALISLRHCAKVVQLMPMGTPLLDAVKTALITTEMMEDILTKHFARLQRMVQSATDDNNLTVVVLAITYPNYLIPNEGSKDFDLYINTYTKLLKIVWGHVKFRIVSEGQAAALYICTPFQDVVRGAMRQQVAKLFDGLNKKTWINLWVFDHGGSSVNLQSVCIRFDSEGNMLHSQSFVRPGQVAGVQSGSHIANDEVRKIVAKTLNKARRRGVPVRDGDLAKYMQSFDRQKTNKDFNYSDYIEGKKSLTLFVEDSVHLQIDLPAADIKKVFGSAFDKGLALLGHEMQRAVEETNDVAILFTGGSYLSLGLRHDVEDTVQAFEAQLQAAKKKINVNYEFMGNLRLAWSPAVCAGAALGLVTMPPLAKILPGFTLGIQAVRKVGEGRDAEWEGSKTVKALLSEGVGAGRVPRFDEHTITPQHVSFKSLRFCLVCDPFYHVGRSMQTVSKFPSIQIQPIRKFPGDEDPLGPYEVGCSLEAAELPLGRVRFSITGKRLEHLMRGRLEDAVVPDMEALPIILNCHSVSNRGEKLRDPLDKKFVLWIKSDPASRFAILGQEQDFKELALPVWCGNCDEEVVTEVGLICPDCLSGYCSACSMHAEHENGCSGEFKSVDMDP